MIFNLFENFKIDFVNPTYCTDHYRQAKTKPQLHPSWGGYISSFSRQIIFSPKNLGTKNIFWLRNVFDPKTFLFTKKKKIILPKSYFRPENFLHPKKYSGPQTFLDPKIFSDTEFVWDQKWFWTKKNFFATNFFGIKFFFGSKKFFWIDPKILGPKIFCDMKICLHKNIFLTKKSFPRILFMSYAN